MTPQPDDHTLNACLARVIGRVVVEEEVDVEKCWAEFGDDGELIDIWCPVADADQMEEVEAWLRANGYSYDYHWWAHNAYHHFNLYHPQKSSTIKGWVGQDPDKKRAFALAVQAMEQAQNGR